MVASSIVGDDGVGCGCVGVGVGAGKGGDGVVVLMGCDAEANVTAGSLPHTRVAAGCCGIVGIHIVPGTVRKGRCTHALSAWSGV